MAFDNEDLMALIDAGTNSDWPDGHAGMITRALLKKFKPDDIMSKAEMKKDIQNIKMKKSEDPVTIFNQILAIELWYKVEIELDEKLAIVLEVCPTKYLSVITSEQMNKGSSLMLEDIQEAMTRLY